MCQAFFTRVQLLHECVNRQVFFSSCIRICKAKTVFSKHIKPAELRIEMDLWR